MDLTAAIEAAARTAYEANSPGQPAWDDLPVIVRATIREHVLPSALTLIGPLARSIQTALLDHVTTTSAEFVTVPELTTLLDEFIATIPAQS